MKNLLWKFRMQDDDDDEGHESDSTNTEDPHPGTEHFG